MCAIALPAWMIATTAAGAPAGATARPSAPIEPLPGGGGATWPVGSSAGIPVACAPPLAAVFDAACEIHVGAWLVSDHDVSQLRRVDCLWPTALAAQEQGVGTLKLAETIFADCLLDRPDPLAAWRQVAERNERAIARLAAASQISVGGEELAIGGVEWRHEAGRTELPGAFVRAELRGRALRFATHEAGLSASLAGRDVAGAIALDGVEVTAW